MDLVSINIFQIKLSGDLKMNFKISNSRSLRLEILKWFWPAIHKAWIIFHNRLWRWRVKYFEILPVAAIVWIGAIYKTHNYERSPSIVQHQTQLCMLPLLLCKRNPFSKNCKIFLECNSFRFVTLLVSFKNLVFFALQKCFMTYENNFAALQMLLMKFIG